MSFVLFPKITSRSLYFLSVYIVGYIPKTRVLFSPSNKLVQGTLNPGVGSFVATISTTPVYKTALSVSQKKWFKGLSTSIQVYTFMSVIKWKVISTKENRGEKSHSR